MLGPVFDVNNMKTLIHPALFLLIFLGASVNNSEAVILKLFM